MSKTTVTTPEARISYPHLFTPRANDQGKMKYSCCLIFPKTADLTELRAAAVAAVVDKYGEKGKEMLQKKQLKTPFRDGSERDGDGFGADTIFINVNSNNQPGVVDKFKDPKTGKARVITDPVEVYPGCFVRALLRAYCYENSGNKGVTFGLEHVQKLRDGERIDGRIGLENAFDAEEPAAAKQDDLVDLLT